MAKPISAAEFAAAMQRFFLFEKNPTIAIGVSGGADSMALLHLAHEWAVAQGGHAIALTVDHNIRAESATETAQVGAWCAALGIDQIVLKWDEPDASSPALQQRARSARHALLAKAAESRGILHLLIAHHMDDQAETVLLRLSKGSGPDGLAGMSAVLHRPQLRLLRPFLGFSKERLVATCQAHGQAWIEDPSNQSLRFARPRLRSINDALASEGLTAHHLALTAIASGKSRAALERATATLLGKCARIMPQGYAEIILADDDVEIQRRALAELIQTIGGSDYQSNTAALDEILQNQTQRKTLGGCLIERMKNKVLIIREERNIEPAIKVETGQFVNWDRFQIWAGAACTVGALGGFLPEGSASDLPKSILATQPAFREEGQVMAIPTIGYYAFPDLIGLCKARFSPKLAAGRADFAIV